MGGDQAATGSRRDGLTVRARRIPGETLTTRESAPVAAAVPGAPTIGVLGLQGDVLEHLRALRRCGAEVRPVRSADELDDLDGLVLPGGESTTIGRLLDLFGMIAPIRARIDDGLPVLATCAGMILLSDELDQSTDQLRIGGLAVRTRRNAFGRQTASFDTRLSISGIDGDPMDVSFIRAPVVVEVLAPDVEVLARVDGHPVVVSQGAKLAAAFHPEITGDDRMHRWLVERARVRRSSEGAHRGRR